jgi:hypothetical protein
MHLVPLKILFTQFCKCQIAVESYEKEKQERESAESSRDVLTVDLERVTQDAKRFSEQVMGDIMCSWQIVNLILSTILLDGFVS